MSSNDTSITQKIIYVRHFHCLNPIRIRNRTQTNVVYFEIHPENFAIFRYHPIIQNIQMGQTSPQWPVQKVSPFDKRYTHIFVAFIRGATVYLGNA